jgi:hypothetical protein
MLLRPTERLAHRMAFGAGLDGAVVVYHDALKKADPPYPKSSGLSD